MEEMLRCLRALADENRLRIMMLLLQQELCVYQIMGILGISQPLASSHLGVLRDAGLVAARREGKRMRYAVAPAARTGGKFGLLRLVREALEGEETLAPDRERLRQCLTFEKEAGACDRRTVRRFRQKGDAK